MKETKCRKCDGPLLKEDGESKCMNCGQVNMSREQRGKFYLDNAEEILKDIKELGPNPAARKWDIPLGSIRGIRDRLSSKFPPLKEQAEGDGPLPNLPAWNDNWKEAVQILWLQVWLCLATRKDKQG